MTNADQREHQRDRLGVLVCSEDARRAAFKLLHAGLYVPERAAVFANEEGTVIFEWEVWGCHIELRVSPDDAEDKEQEP